MFTTRATIGWIPNTTYGLGMSSITLSCGQVVWGMGGAINGSFSYTYSNRDGRTGTRHQRQQRLEQPDRHVHPGAAGAVLPGHPLNPGFDPRRAYSELAADRSRLPSPR